VSGYISVFLRAEGRIYLSSDSKVVMGPYVPNGWVRALPADCSDEELGQLVLEGLDQTKLDIPEPSREELAKLARAMNRFAGVTSASKFHVGTKCVSVERDVADALEVYPARNIGPRRGFMFHTADHAVDLHWPYEASDVGAAVREWLARARV
jgi:hypothetical protein